MKIHGSIEAPPLQTWRGGRGVRFPGMKSHRARANHFFRISPEQYQAFPDCAGPMTRIMVLSLSGKRDEHNGDGHRPFRS